MDVLLADSGVQLSLLTIQIESLLFTPGLANDGYIVFGS